MIENPFLYKSPIFEKLEEYGFEFDGGTYRYETHIMNKQFTMRVFIARRNGEVKTELTDNGTGDLYTLHLVEGAGGAFIGRVRAEYERVLTDMVNACFENDVFKSPQAHEIIEYVRAAYGDELEYLWNKFPSNAVWRRKDNDKWYGIMLILSKRKLGLDSDEVANMIDLRIDPDELDRTVDGVKYFRGYHMNKKHWFTICLDGSVPTEEIIGWLDKSYALAKK